MIKKITSLISVLLCALMCSALIACNSSSNSSDSTTSESAKEGAQNIGEGVKDIADKAGETAKDVAEDMKFTAVRFKDDLAGAGYELKESAGSKFDKFSGTETDYYLGDDDDIVRVYEYNSKEELNKDIEKISPDGLTIDGVKKYEEKPYYYSKDNVLIVYEGDDSTYVSELNNKYGHPII